MRASSPSCGREHSRSARPICTATWPTRPSGSRRVSGAPRSSSPFSVSVPTNPPRRGQSSSLYPRPDLSAKFSKCRVGDKVPVFWTYPAKFPHSTEWNRWTEASMPKLSSICPDVLTQYWLVTDDGRTDGQTDGHTTTAYTALA